MNSQMETIHRYNQVENFFFLIPISLCEILLRLIDKVKQFEGSIQSKASFIFPYVIMSIPLSSIPLSTKDPWGPKIVCRVCFDLVRVRVFKYVVYLSPWGSALIS
ncbi:hypothetical protein GBA52_025443 [Prunus armeniaca]|nr:hypothetical protein GBA52_025443 [Prunus armeniaca]